MKLFYLLTFLGLLPFGVFSQTVNRQPKKTVQTDVESKSNSDVVIIEGNRTTTIHPDGSRTITVKATQVTPAQYSNESNQEAELLPSAYSWTKEDLLLYIESLEAKKTIVSNNPEEHTKALESGWYDFIDEMINQAKSLLSEMN